MLRAFIRWNRARCHALQREHPNALDGPRHVEVLVGEFQRHLRDGLAVLEVGGIDRPMLRKGEGYRYDGMDLESREACLSIYDTFYVQSIERPIPENYDLIVSTTLLEHVRDNDASIANMARALNPGGKTLHYVPSKWHPYSISLRLVGPAVQKRLIPLLRPGSEHVTGYPAFFHRCSPAAMTALFESAGLRNVRVTPFFRANDYFAFFLPFFFIVSWFENLCRAWDLRVFASGFVIVGEKAPD